MNLELILEKLDLNKKNYETINEITKCVYGKEDDTLFLQLQCKTLFPFKYYELLMDRLRLYTRSKVKIQLNLAKNPENIEMISDYMNWIIAQNRDLQIFRGEYPILEEGAIIYYTNKQIEHQALMKLNTLLNKLGILMEIEIKKNKNEVTNITMPKIETPKKELREKTPEKKQYQSFKKEYVPFTISEINEPCFGISVEAEVFEIENRILKGGASLQILYIKDADDAISAKRFLRKPFTQEDFDNVKVGDKYRFIGDIENDLYSNALVFNIKNMEKLTVILRNDNATNKRVELHLHTKMSEMDGVSDIQEYIKTAARWGHSAISINDHAVIQSFPKAQHILANVNKTLEKPMKLIYGVEMDMVESKLNIVRNPDNQNLFEAKYCVLDFETTGLSTWDEHIIEFGGQHMDNMRMENSLQLFVKAPIKIPSFIEQLTNISDDLLEKEGKPIEEALDEIVAFIGDRIIVAHNAEFDYSFLNDTLIRYGREPLKNPVIDTLDFSKRIHANRRAHKLGTIARNYGIRYDDQVAHRADYDTEVLTQVFIKMLEELPEHVQTLNDLQNYQDETSFMKNYGTHINVLVKNSDGLKALFELITLSHTKYLSYREGSSVASPKIIREEIIKKRKNLLIGSACSNNELFELALHRNPQKLEEAMQFYDFIEIQPRDCYRHLLRRNIIKSEEHLLSVINKIITTAKKCNKIVVATSDAHYVEKQQKNIRDIYISAQGIGGVRHPLYIYNKEDRTQAKTYPQYLLTTEEMLQEFSYLPEQEAYDIVVTNTNKIADMIEQVYPVKQKLYPPEIKDADKKLREITYANAYKMYGNPLPKIVADRLEKELNSIIGNGFHVVYYISHLLVKKSLDDGYLVGSRGSVGSSLVATMTEITEVNPLVAHYYCPKCQFSEFYEDGSVASGYDLPDRNCPNCGEKLKGDGQDIPFETFLGFEGDKVPDIDLNFSGVYQPIAHNYTKEVFGEDYVFRAGTIGTVAMQTAFGYVRGYQEEMDIPSLKPVQIKRLAKEADGVKRTTGQHPGGIIVIPDYMDVHDFTPVQYPANNPNADWKTTHFEFHDIHDNVLKLDILGHVDPTAMKFLENISGINPLSIPMNDKEVMKIFHCVDSLKIDTTKYREKTGAAGIPEFGTQFVRQMLETTKPSTFDELVRISGLSHGTDVWLGNAKDLIEKNVCTLKEVIGCRDDIMVYLIHKGLPSKEAFNIMESVRKGKGLKDEWVELMKKHNVESWYIESCKKIKYMFPKAHAAAYVLMAVRIAWFKVHYPIYYYAMFFSIRCDAYDIDTMIKGEADILNRMQKIKDLGNTAPKKEKDIYSTLELALEMYLRGYRFSKINIELSHATEFIVDPNDSKALIPPFTSIDGLGESVAESIVAARKEKPFLSKEDLRKRTSLSTTLLKKMEDLDALTDLSAENQLTLF